MKRPEMIERLDKILNSRLYQDYQMSEEDLGEILDEIEEAGMIPPYTEKQKSEMMPHTDIPDAVARTLRWEEE